MSGLLLEVDGLVRRFGGIAALDGCTLAAERGSVTGVVGPNGSGKTTLFNCITGLLRADAGHILFRGRQISGSPPDHIARSGLGRTFQTTRVFEQLTVMENLSAATYLSGRGTERSGIAILERFGLTGFLRTQAGELSYGQQKLVELAAVMATSPELVLLDEPAAGVSPALLEHLAACVRELSQDGVAFVVVEHNMPFVFALCDVIFVLDAGKTIATGSPSEVRANDRVLAAYLGEETSDA
jgi:neutral amino acid transport system ATP-binding protein